MTTAADQYALPGTGVATTGAGGGDPYSSHGAKAAQEGTYLSFSKGEYLYGQNKDELPIGKRLVANMPELRLGYRCWKDGKVVEDRTELLSAMRPEERRSDLGDTDQGLWERDDRGEPRDPWSLTNVLELADPETGECYTFSTNSGGGKKAIGRLCKEYGREYRMRPGMLPVVELQRESYMHSNPRFGKIYNPVLTIVGWTDAAGVGMDAGAIEADDDIPFGREPAQAPPADQNVARSSGRTRF